MLIRNRRVEFAIIALFVGALSMILLVGTASAADGDNEETYDWWGYGYEKGQYDAMYGRQQNPDYWDNEGDDDYYEGYSSGYESVNFMDWFAEGLANGKADKAQGYGYQPLAWPNDGSPNYYAGYDSGYYGTPINWYNAGWYNGLNDGRNGLLYRPDIYYNNQSGLYNEGYYDGYYGSYAANAQPPGLDEQNDADVDGTSGNNADSETDQSTPASSRQSSFTVDDPECVIDGEAIVMDVAPYASNNRVLVPLRYLAYMCGLNDQDIMWDPATHKAVLQKPGGSTLVFTADAASYQVDGQTLLMDVAPASRDNRLFIPARYAAENLGCTVAWDAVRRIATITLGQST